MKRNVGQALPDNKIKSHSQEFLLGISHIRFCTGMYEHLLNVGNKQMEDPRQKPSGMTTYLQAEALNKSDFRAPLRSGFTLIELLVVVLIIAILAAVALPQYQLAVDKARVKSAFPVMRAIINAENLHKLEHGDYTYNWEELDLDIPHIKYDKTKRAMYTDNGVYSLDSDGTSHVFFSPNEMKARIYAAFPMETWLCYPQGTSRGKALCKSLGCSADKLESLYCRMKPYL